MKIALIGYGKMGRMIHEIARSRNYNIICIIDEDNRKETDPDKFREADVAFEFTGPESAVANIIYSFKKQVPVVSGTTGWLDKWEYIREQCKKYNGSLFYASNFSLGVNLLFRINKILAELIEPFGQYRPQIEEIHHVNKLDAPSGTAISLANQIIENNKNVNTWKLNPYGEKDPLPVFSIREGAVTGTHTVSYVSDIDKITIQHEAFNRKGFATGAMAAAEFLVGKKGIFSMDDLLFQ